MIRRSLKRFLLLGWCAVVSISCSESVPHPNFRPAPQPALSESLEATLPTSSETSASTIESSEGKVDAEDVLKNALARATAEDKSVLIHLGAPW